MSLSSFFSSFLPTVHADAPEEKPAEEETPTEEPAAEEEEEEEEPEDVCNNLLLSVKVVIEECCLQILPALKDECAESSKCAAATKHFQHCQEKVNAGEGFHGENCIEELCVLCYRCLVNCY